MQLAELPALLPTRRWKRQQERAHHAGRMRGAPAALVPLLLAACQHAPPAGAPTSAVTEVVRDSIPGTLVSFEMVAVPADPAAGVRGFFIGRTELLWDVYDEYMMSRPDTAGRKGADAVARPSRPYGAPDYGWGHRGFPTISVAREAAVAFCEWLSERTGKRYRLPTDAEWRHVARRAAGSDSLPRTRLDSLAWHAGNSGGRTHAAASRSPDAMGLFDLFGNAGEWVLTADERRVILGGSFRDPPDAVGPLAEARQDDSWTERDPQIPKSRWWMSDAPFAGFRIVRDRP